MSTRQSFDEFPKRGKLAVLVISIVFSLSVYSFMVFEKLSLLDSIYFLIVTVSTVGFGDIQPKHEFTKIVLILLIITGISTLAMLSEIAIDKIVLMRAVGNYDLPSESLNLDNHIIFSQLNDVVEKIAIYAQDRFFNVVILDRVEEAVKSARRKGYMAYLGEIEDPQTLELLSLDRASALYLFLDDDNHIIQASILAQNLAPDLLVYASTNDHLSIDYGKIVGITRTYHNERLLGSFISNNVRPFDAIVLPNQEADDSIFRVALLKNNEKYLDYLKMGTCVGIIDNNFMDIKMLTTQEEVFEYPKDRRVLVAFTKYDDLSGLPAVVMDRPFVYDKILIAGWNQNIGHLVEHLDIDHDKIQYFTFDEAEYEIAKSNGYDILYCNRENVVKTINENLTDKDFVINNFKQITDSLLLDVMIRRSDVNPQILQIVNQEQEFDVFQKIGVNQVISPDILTSRAMFQILLTDLNLINSAIFRGHHMFEHTVKTKDLFHRKSISKINNKLGYQVLILHKANTKDNIFLPTDGNIETNDRLLLYRVHSKYDKRR